MDEAQKLFDSKYTGLQIEEAIAAGLELRNDPQLALANLGARPNKNLLDNWCFVGGGVEGQFPINQRGQTEYTVNGYCIDRWFSSGNTVKLDDDGLLITTPSSGYIFGQAVWMAKQLSGKTVTLSVDATVISGRWYLTDTGYFSTQHADYQINDGVTSWKFIANSPSNIAANAGIGLWGQVADSQIKVRNIKLELGSTQTLAHQEGGKWVLNEIPNYAEQLARCQRYALDITPSVTYNDSYIGECGKNYASFCIPIPVTMRTVPAFVGDPGKIQIAASNGTFLAPTDVRVVSYGSNYINIRCIIPDGVVDAGMTCNLRTNDASTKLMLSADL